MRDICRAARVSLNAKAHLKPSHPVPLELGQVLLQQPGSACVVKVEARDVGLFRPGGSVPPPTETNRANEDTGEIDQFNRNSREC